MTERDDEYKDKYVDLLVDVWCQFSCPVDRSCPAGLGGAAHDGGISVLEFVCEELVLLGKLYRVDQDHDWYRYV